MIGRLTGIIVDEGSDGSVVIDVGGVGYEALVPVGTLGRLGASDLSGAREVTLFVHTHVREDVLALYGFASREDRAVFRTLIAISNVGPKLALAVLGTFPASELAAAIMRGDAPSLTKVPGVGKKTAERLLLELKDKLLLPPTAAPPKATSAPVAAPATGQRGMLLGALTRMGYRPAEAERAVVSLEDDVESAPLGDLVRKALLLLSR